MLFFNNFLLRYISGSSLLLSTNIELGKTPIPTVAFCSYYYTLIPKTELLKILLAPFTQMNFEIYFQKYDVTKITNRSVLTRWIIKSKKLSKNCGNDNDFMISFFEKSATSPICSSSICLVSLSTETSNLK